MLARKLSSSGTAQKLYVDDVFSTYLHTGNDSAQTINNGIDLAGKGGLVWVKARNVAFSHRLFDRARGVNNVLDSTTTAGQSNYTSLTAFNANGFTVGAQNTVNGIPFNYTSWTFRKAPKFFDVVTWTGNGANPGSQTIAHSLGAIPGMVVCKKTSSTSNWFTFHRSLATKTDYLFLNTTAAATTSGGQIWDATVTDFTVYAGAGMNESGATYVAYLFAHDPSADGIIQCGGFTTDGGGNATVNHGWAKGVQFALLKASSTTGDWEMFDTARTSGWSGNDARLQANLTNAEDSVSRLSASGSNVSFTGLSAGATYIYMFIVNP